MRHPPPYLQRYRERRDAVQTETARRTPRPRNTLCPGLIIRFIVLLPGADSRDEEKNNPQSQTRHDTLFLPGVLEWGCETRGCGQE